jgi:hypothetical protein
MAMRHKIAGLTGTLKAPRLSITVWDTSGAAVAEEDAIAYADNVAPDEYLGCLQSGDPQITRRSRSIYELSIAYTPADLQRPEAAAPRPTGTLARRVSFQARPIDVFYALEPIGVYDAIGDATGNWPTRKWMINAQWEGFHHMKVLGATIEPLAETRTLDYSAPNTVVTDEYLDRVEALCGHFCDDVFLGKPQGSLQLVRFSAVERTPNDWELSFGFGYKAPELNRKFDAIIVPEIRGSWYHWARQIETYDEEREVVEPVTKQVFVSRVWPEGDFGALDLPAITYPAGETIE